MDYWNNYHLYFEQNIPGRLISHNVLKENIEKYANIFDVEKIGLSNNNKEIYKITIGNGPKNLLLWSQMHGNEATATGSIFDLLNYFDKNSQKQEVQKLLADFTISFIPMLNPDGAANWTRVNQLGIDLNRDAVKQTAIESKILWKEIDNLKPYLSFNLHDQRNIFSVGNTDKTATISFLSASFNIEKDLNDNRRHQMWLIGEMEKELSKNIQGHIAKYTDEFYPTATGDNLQKKNYSNILIESGTFVNDPDRYTARKANFAAILKAFELLRSDLGMDTSRYDAIPNNSIKLFDLLIRNVKVTLNGNSSIVDLGIMYNEAPDKDYKQMLKFSKIENIGDLSHFYGIKEMDAEQRQFTSNTNTYPKLMQEASFELGEIKIENSEIS